MNYEGPAEVLLDDRCVQVEIRLSARFEPVDGRLRWSGRTGPDDVLRERVSGGLRSALLVVAGRRTPVRLSEPDPWGGVRLSGVGAPPWRD